MSGKNKITIKTLSEEVNNLKEQVKEMNMLQQRVTDLEQILKNLKIKESFTTDIHKCRKCDKTFESKKALKKHFAEEQKTVS